MRYKAGHKEEARARMLAAAGRGFRRQGYGGIGVDGLAKEAEVTSGAFYGHFSSKGEAFKAALVAGLEELRVAVENLRDEHGAKWVEVFVDFYLGQKRVCELGSSCALQSLTSEVQRADAEIKTVFEAAIEGVVNAVADGLLGRSRKEKRARAWALLSILSGGVTMARAVADKEVSAAIASACRVAALNACAEA
ncbi:TetR/AcrR family transcriptional regulator [Bradyrhizobium manausense]|uniref:TetR/AcrR family transcriptional regulator n=1 Tax=Bradyrhizobium TaxID=374 RepID=UPI001BA8D754|nr:MULTISPECIES: TetR/AcrR family transcriptional regulator [Bradyrhizobium]MBR0826556.1 TetR/AcrR family transcriptional regulator [Bradyrhizobium manausense]UVO28948.1 TetR/AcrR family transcriptional regulator [Bradyrhizobium arachidis]